MDFLKTNLTEEAFTEESLSEFTQKIRLAVNADFYFENSLKFRLQDSGVIYIYQNDVSNEDLPADCTITLSLKDCLLITRGVLDPLQALMSGRMKIEGDMSVAMKLKNLMARFAK